MKELAQKHTAVALFGIAMIFLSLTVPAEAHSDASLTHAAPSITRSKSVLASERTVTQLVAASSHVSSLPSEVAAELATSNADSPQRVYPELGFAGCAGGSSCTFGVKHARRVIVLFGDSHAMMWLPAVDVAATRAGDRLVLIWAPGRCAIAQLPTTYSYSGTSTSGCSAWHANAIHLIKSLHPRLVILGERTSEVYSEPEHVLFTKSQWQSGLVKAITQLKKLSTHVALIEDVMDFDTPPQACLAAYPTDVQSQCSLRVTDLNHPGQQSAEKAAATVTGTGFVSTLPWFCTSTCSPVIGSYLPYYDENHVSATYAKYLSGVMTTALKSYL